MTGKISDYLQVYLDLGLTPIPLKPRSKEPLVKWGNGWNPTLKELKRRARQPGINWGIQCGAEIAALDFDSENAFRSFIEAHPEANSWPSSKTGRGYHLLMRPKKPIRSQRLDGIEIKCLGSYVVVPPSIHPSGTEYCFEKPLNGNLIEVDIEELLGSGAVNQANKENLGIENAPSDFALRYGRSHYPQSLCGRATKVFTRSDEKLKHLLSLRQKSSGTDTPSI
jgi:hypothetical protein